jgi:hypothetical protein
MRSSGHVPHAVQRKAMQRVRGTTHRSISSGNFRRRAPAGWNWSFQTALPPRSRRATAMRTKKPTTKARKLPEKGLARLVGLASHAAMGAAMGLAFAFIATRSDMFGVTPLISTMASPDGRLFDLEITCAIGFGLAAMMTGMASSLGDDSGD